MNTSAPQDLILLTTAIAAFSSGIAAGFNTLGTAFFPLVFLCLLMSQMYKQEEVSCRHLFITNIYELCYDSLE